MKKPKPAKSPRLTRVYWHDMAQLSGWFTSKQIALFEPAPCISVGYLVENNDKWLILASDVVENDDDMFGGLILIQWCCIDKWEYLG